MDVKAYKTRKHK